MTYRRFGFEGDIHDTLDCVPMAGRRQLDLARLKISLSGWQALPRAKREALLGMGVSSAGEIEAFTRALRDAAAAAGVELKALPGSAADEALRWDAGSVPDEVARACGVVGVVIAAARWAGLDEDERFTIAKLADPKRTPDKLAVALVELGLSEGPAAPVTPDPVVCR